MQKVKEVLTGHRANETGNTVGDRASREYADSSLTGNGSQNAGSRLTGDSAATGTTTGSTGLTGAGRSSTAVGSTDSIGVDNVGRTGATGSSSIGNRITGDSAAVGTGATSTGTLGNSTTTGTTSGSTGSRVASGLTHLTDRHSEGHDNSLASKFDPAAETTHHDHKHLHHVTQRDVRHIEAEEVQRERNLEKHVHHVQHHVQPVTHREVGDEVHHSVNHPVTKITEHHVNTDDDVNLFRGLGDKYKDTETHRPKERTVIDLGEKVNETVHHHVHHITQPVVQTEVHDRHRIHTVIPTHHVTHEAPIIHKSSLHEPIGLEDFKKGGGVLGSNVSLDNAGVLQTGECTREVDGVGEKLAQELHLGTGSRSIGNSATTGTTGTTTGARTSGVSNAV